MASDGCTCRECKGYREGHEEGFADGIEAAAKYVEECRTTTGDEVAEAGKRDIATSIRRLSEGESR